MATTTRKTPRYISPVTFEQIADSISKDAKLNADEPGAIDVVKLAKYFGCEVQTVTFDPTDISAKIHRNKDGGCIIQVASSESPRRQRFSIAHEVSHYVLHDDEEFIEYRKPLSDYDSPDLLFKEVQANMLASALLMPQKLVKRAWESTKDLDDLAEIFNVSKTAVYYRLDNLGLLGSE